MLVPGWLQLIETYNPHGMWSFGRSFDIDTNVLLTVLSAIAVAAILLWARIGMRPEDRRFAIVLGAVLGGAVGNLYDRLRYAAVRDFIDAHYFEVYHYPTFNFADSFLVCGALYLLASSFFQAPEIEPSEDLRRAT